MFYINFKDVQAAREGLLGQIFILREVQERLEQAERQIREMSLTEEASRLLRKSSDAVQEEIRGLREMADCLSEVVRLYQRTERQVADVYDLEVINYPKTVFARSSFSSLEDNQSLISFRTL